LEIKVKNGIDSLALLPATSIEASLSQTVTRLSDYSSDGLDIDLILFRLCEISINKGFTKNQTDSLFQNAIDAWSKKKLQQVTNITNNGNNYGIMAQNVIVPEDKEIPLVDNYSVNIVTDTVYTHANKTNFIYEIKPKKGVWLNPFAAYPLSEDSIVNGRFVPYHNQGFYMHSKTYLAFINEKKDTVEMNVQTSSNIPSIPNSGFLFICDKTPSVLLFGDSIDPTKTYSFSSF